MARNYNFDSLGVWPKDCTSQQEWVNRLRSVLMSMDEHLNTNTPVVILLNQSVEPTQEEWETAWQVQSGSALPIPPTADLVWYNTSSGVVAGHFRTIEGDTTVYRREHIWPHGSIVATAESTATTSRTVNYFILENLGHYPIVTITLPTLCDLRLTGILYAELTAGSGYFGVDFLLNGVKVGTQYYLAASDQGIININSSQLVVAEATVPNLPAGTYSVRLTGGLVGSPASPPTYMIGGISGASARGTIQLVARGIAL